MQIKFILTTLLCLAIAASANQPGTWSKPFDNTSFNSIEAIYGASKSLWFTTENGIGHYVPDSKECRFYPYSTTGITFPPAGYKHSLISGDSSTVNLFTKNINNYVSLLRYDGSRWSTTTCPDKQEYLGRLLYNVKANDRGITWVNDSKLMDYFNGKVWVGTSRTAFDSIYQVYQVDDDGNLLVGLSTITGDSTIVARYDGNDFSPVVTIHESPKYSTEMMRDAGGSFWIAGKSALYKIGERQATAYQLDTNLLSNVWPALMAIDTSGNFYNVIYNREPFRKELIRYNINSGTTEVLDSTTDFFSIAICNNELYYADRLNPFFLRFTSRSAQADTVRIQTEEHRYGNLNLSFSETPPFYRKDGSIITTHNQRIFSWKGASISELPSIASVNTILESHDGALTVFLDDQTFHQLNGNSWRNYLTSEPEYAKYMLLDKNNTLWGCVFDFDREDYTIIHQSEKGWELIDSSNCNLDYYFNQAPEFYEAGNGEIWINLYNAAASTKDGYSWTFHDSADGLPAYYSVKMYINKAGQASLLYLDQSIHTISGSSQMDTTARIIRCVFDNNRWKCDTLTTPLPHSKSNECFEDSKGALWIQSFAYEWPSLRAKSAYYQQNNDSWICHDSTTTTFNLYEYHGEDAAGTMYFSDFFGETVAYKRDGIGVSRVSKKRTAPPLPLHCSAKSKSFLLEYETAAAQKVTVTLFTPKGQQLQTVVSGVHPAGKYQKTVPVNLSSGCYLVRLTTPEGSQVARVVLR